MDGGEVYINAEGKKVRRVRKSRTPSLGISKSILEERSKKGDRGQQRRNLKGKVKVLINLRMRVRLKRTVTQPLSPGTPTSSVQSEGDEVLQECRGQKSSEKAVGLATVLQSGAASKPGASGSATVAGDTARKDGEIYIRADGKKVRRVRRSNSAQAKKSLGGFLASGES